MFELPSWLLVVIGILVYSGTNGFVLSCQLIKFLKVKRFWKFFKDTTLISAASACIVLWLQSLYLVYECRAEILALKYTGRDYNDLPIEFNTACFLVQSALPVIIVLGMIKIVIQLFIIHEEYYIDTVPWWRMVVISNSCSCLVQYFVVSSLMTYC